MLGFNNVGETFLSCGWDETEKALMALYGEFDKVKKAFDHDDKKVIFKKE